MADDVGRGRASSILAPMPAVADPALDRILAGVSRSFYLSLTILPRPVRAQIAAAYLVARAADTVADTPIASVQRRGDLLAALRGVIRGACDRGRLDGPAEALCRELEAVAPTGTTRSHAAERELLGQARECLGLLAAQDAADRERAGRVLDALITGMERDLARFPGEARAPEEARAMVAGGAGVAHREPRPAAFPSVATMAELDEHTYLAAGCVGEYWTEMIAAHLPAASGLAGAEQIARGVRLGKALQMVNVIRDAPADLAAGRCYVPLDLLRRHGLGPDDLLGPERRRARPVIDELIALALGHVDAAWPYVMAIPRRAPRLRLACIWPLWNGQRMVSKKWPARATTASYCNSSSGASSRPPEKHTRWSIRRCGSTPNSGMSLALSSLMDAAFAALSKELDGAGKEGHGRDFTADAGWCAGLHGVDQAQRGLPRLRRHHANLSVFLCIARRRAAAREGAAKTLNRLLESGSSAAGFGLGS